MDQETGKEGLPIEKDLLRRKTEPKKHKFVSPEQQFILFTTDGFNQAPCSAFPE